MGDMMTFPASVEEFMEQYKMTDTDHVYSNGTEYVPIYRMKQWFEHCRNQQLLTIDAGPVVRCRECKHRYTENCPMYFHDFYWLEGYGEYVDDDTDHTEDDYFCPKGERKEGADNEP